MEVTGALEEAEATMCIGDATVDPFDGELTLMLPASAAAENVATKESALQAFINLLNIQISWIELLGMNRDYGFINSAYSRINA